MNSFSVDSLFSPPAEGSIREHPSAHANLLAYARFAVRGRDRRGFAKFARMLATAIATYPAAGLDWMQSSRKLSDALRDQDEWEYRDDPEGVRWRHAASGICLKLRAEIGSENFDAFDASAHMPSVADAMGPGDGYDTRDWFREREHNWHIRWDLLLSHARALGDEGLGLGRRLWSLAADEARVPAWFRPDPVLRFADEVEECGLADAATRLRSAASMPEGSRPWRA